MAVISKAHTLAGLSSPRGTLPVQSVMDGIARTFGVAQEKKKALVRDAMKKLLASVPPGIAGLRAKAILLWGWAGAYRRSELVATDPALPSTLARLRPHHPVGAAFSGFLGLLHDCRTARNSAQVTTDK